MTDLRVKVLQDRKRIAPIIPPIPGFQWQPMARTKVFEFESSGTRMPSALR